MVKKWTEWCRLCGNYNNSVNRDAFDSFKHQKLELSFRDVIAQLFSVFISESEEVTICVCETCSDFLQSLCQFSQQAKYIQQMYLEIQLEEKLGNKININVIRSKYGLEKINDCLYIENDTIELKNEKTENEEILVELNEEIYWANEENSQNSSEVETVKTEAINSNINEIEKESSEVTVCQVDTIQCEACPKVFAQISRYLLHLKRKHNIIKDPPPKQKTNPDEIIYCKLCGKGCGNRGAYVTHMQKKHVNAKIEQPELYECKTCLKKFKHKMILNKHEETHLSKDKRILFPCAQCSKKFLNEYLVQAHVKNVHLKERPFVCEICGKGTTSKRTLDDHKLVHVEATLKCKVCSQLFKTQQRLKVHMKTHENFNVPCLICNLKLKNNQSLKEHMLTHSEKKDFECPFCGNAFRCRRNLRAHMLIHTGLKPYHCSFCSVSYANRSNCKKHEKHAHPLEFAEMEAKGVKTHSKNVPKFNQLKLMMEEMKSKVK